MRSERFSSGKPQGAKHSPAASFPIHVECGRHAEDLEPTDFRACRHGLSFKTRWPIAVGTELAVELLFEDPLDAEGFPEFIEVTAIVIECVIEPETAGAHRVSLIFIDIPGATGARIEQLSARATPRVSF